MSGLVFDKSIVEGEGDLRELLVSFGFLEKGVRVFFLYEVKLHFEEGTIESWTSPTEPNLVTP